MSETRVVNRTCPLCEAMCGLQVHVEDEQVTLIRADRDDVWSKGYLCPKGTTLGHLYHDGDRIRVPLVRDGERWREVTWAEAFAECERLLHGVRDRHGANAISTYIGNPTVHNFSLSRYVPAFIALAAIGQTYSAGTIDQWPKNVSCHLMYGSMWQIPAPDVERTDYWVVMGANPQASQGSLLAAPDLLGAIDRIRARGGKTLVIDPRRTGTADRADEWVPIMPGTDAAFLMAVLHVLFEEGLTDLGDLADVVNGFDELPGLVTAFSPEAVAATCRVPAETIRRIAREIAAAPSAAVYGRIGLCNQEFGTLASWLIDVVNIVTGNFDRPGGLMFGNPVAPSLMTIRNPLAEVHQFGRHHSRVRGAPEVLGAYPSGCLPEEIDTPGEGQIKALITIAGNPVISAPEAARLDAALPLLEAMISVDIYLNETTRHADVILPALSALEQPHYDEAIWTWALRSAAKWSDAVFPPPADRPAEWEILLRLAAICSGTAAADVDVRALDDTGFSMIVAGRSIDPHSKVFEQDPAQILAEYAEHAGGPERFADFAVRSGPWGDGYGTDPDGLTLQDVKDAPHGLDFGPAVPRARQVLATPSGRIELAPPYITADLARLEARLARPDDGLLLVSRRHVRSNNSWMHNIRVLMKGKDRCTLLVHPDDAGRLGLADGEGATVTSEAGAIEAPVEVSDEMMPGVVCLPHGWGHGRPGTQQSVAADYPGVNNNLLAPGDFIDEISNNAAVNGIPVEVVPAGEPAAAVHG